MSSSKDQNNPREKFSPNRILFQVVLWLAATLISVLVSVGAVAVSASDGAAGHWAVLAVTGVIALVFLALLVVHQVYRQGKVMDVADESIQALEDSHRSTRDALASDLQKLRTDLTKKILSVDYVSAARERSAIHDEAKRQVLKARNSIVVLTSYLLDSKPDTPDVQRKKHEYFDSLLEHVREQSRLNPQFRYTRIVQCKKRSDLEAFANDGPYRDHILAMIKCCEEEGLLVQVKVAEHARPTTFIVIDNSYLLWQINSVETPGADGKPDELAAEGIFTISDPNQEIIRHHLHAFWQIEHQSAAFTEEEKSSFEAAKARDEVGLGD